MSTLHVIFLSAGAAFGLLAVAVVLAGSAVGAVAFLPQILVLGSLGLRRHA